MRTLAEKYSIIQGLEPKTTNLATVSDYVSLKNVVLATAIVHLTQAVGHATEITLFQAKVVAGTGAKAIANVVPIWANEDVSASDALVRQTDAVAYTVANDAKNKVIVFQIEPSKLDINNAFTCLQVRIAASSQATDLATIEFILDGKYEQKTPPSVIVD